MPKPKPESAVDAKSLPALLESRFRDNPSRHPGLDWKDIAPRLKGAKLETLLAMELSGGEPDVVDYDKKRDAYLFCDCAAESPAGRHSLCYDEAALASRKEAKPEGSALGLCARMGAQLLDEEGYRKLQGLGEFDLKTSSWLLTPEEVRKKGGAIFGDRRYGRVFVYHNGAESYYGARGFRASLKV